MTIRVLQSTANDAPSAVSELASQLGGTKPEFVLFFASPRYDTLALGSALRDHFPAPSIGCTTAGEIVSGKMLEGSLVAMVMDSEHVAQAVVQSIADTHDDASVAQAYHELVSAMGSLDEPEQLLGLVLHDGMSASEEKVMSTLSTLSNIPFIGGSAGDDVKFERTFTFTNGRGIHGGAALALVRLRKRHRLLKTQSFSLTDQVLEATDVDERARRVKQFNGRPATVEYARVLGVPVSELPGRFMRNPVAILVGDAEPFVRSPQKVEGTDVLFYCEVQQGTDLRVLESRNIVEDTARDLEAAISDFGPVSGIINFHCILRTLELKERGQMQQYGALFANVPTVGFSTYGESYIGHMNQTSTMVLLE